MQFVSFEVSPVCTEPEDGGTYCSVCEEDEAEFWGVYGRCLQGFATHIADYSTRQEAETAVRCLEQERFFVAGRPGGVVVTTLDRTGRPNGHEVSGVLDSNDAKNFAAALNLLVSLNYGLNEAQKITDKDEPKVAGHKKLRKYLVGLYAENDLSEPEIARWRTSVEGRKDRPVSGAE